MQSMVFTLMKKRQKNNMMDSDKQQELINDATKEGSSNCCGAKVYMGDICSDCKEHCGIISDEDEEIPAKRGYTLDELEQKWEADKQWDKDHAFQAGIISIYDFFRYRLPGHLDDAYYSCKYAWQRVFRGYDDRMIFSYCHENAEQTLQILKWFRHNRMGSPLVKGDNWDKQKEEFTTDIHEDWNVVLDKMIAGFEAVIAEDDVHLKDADGKYDHAASNIERERLNKIWEEGRALFIKHYRGLWD